MAGMGQQALLRRNSRSMSRRSLSSTTTSRSTSAAQSRSMTPQRSMSAVSLGALGLAARASPTSRMSGSLVETLRGTRELAIGDFDEELGSECLQTSILVSGCLQTNSLRLPLNPSASAEESYWHDLVPNLSLSHQWLSILNLISCCCCIADQTCYARSLWTGDVYSSWTSIILNLTCDFFWFISGIFFFFDFDPDKYPFMGIGRRPRPSVEGSEVEDGPSEEVLQDDRDLLHDIEARLGRRFDQEFACIGRRLADLELCMPGVETNGTLDRPSPIPEHNVLMSASELAANPPAWRLEDHLASLGARLHEIEVALSEGGDASEPAATPQALRLESISGELFERGKDMSQNSSSTSSCDEFETDSELPRMKEFERQDLERAQLQRLHDEELKSLEELEHTMMELEKKSQRERGDSDPSVAQAGEPWGTPPELYRAHSMSELYSAPTMRNSISNMDVSSTDPSEETTRHENSDEEELSSGESSGQVFSATLSIIPLSGRVSELEVLVAKIVSQLCTSSTLSDRLKDNLRTITHQALRKRIPAQRSMVLQGPAHHRSRSQRVGRVVPGKAVVGKPKTPSTVGALRHRRTPLSVPHGRQHGVLPHGRQHSKVVTSSGPSHRPLLLRSGASSFGGTPGQPAHDSQGRL